MEIVTNEEFGCYETTHHSFQFGKDITLDGKKLTVSEWIPVSEGLPEAGIDVLVTTATGFIFIGWIDEDKTWRISDVDWFDPCNHVLAWMLLPKPYNAESEE